MLFPGELTSIIQRSALDYKASPSVLKECKHSIEICKKHTGDFDGSQDDFEDGGVIEGKRLHINKCCQFILVRYCKYDNK